MQQSVSVHAAPKTLTDLPLELRKQIYAYVIVNEYEIWPMRNLWAPGAGYSEEVHNQLNLTLVSRHIRFESLQVFLSHNTFNLCVSSSRWGKLPSAAELGRRWRVELGERMRHIRRIVYEVRQSVNESPAKTRIIWSDYRLYLGAEVVVKHGSAAAMRNGTCIGTMVERCGCELERRLRLAMQKVGGYDGRVLLQFAESLELVTDGLEWAQCAVCERSRLVEPAPAPKCESAKLDESL